MNEEMVMNHLTAEQRHLHHRLQKILKLFAIEGDALPTAERINELHGELTELRAS